ncbi:TPA: dATP/dGTP pyrophosphohydrolase domain-containing protein [Klebsiella michiganensis]
MTSKLTKERLQEIAEDGFLKHGESKELARMALAAMDIEPVILYRQVNPTNGMKTYWAELDPEEFRHLKKYTDENAEFMTLYRHTQPAPERDQVRREHAEWSQTTFGNVGPVGPLKHLAKEAMEAAAEPDDLSEWADMQFLLWDAQRRAGITDEQITQAMIEKLAVNKQREWPEPKDGEPRMHIKEQPALVIPDEISLEKVAEMTAARGAEYSIRDGIIAAKWWNACRAAMLAAAPQPQNAPQNIPEIIPGWIQVSERVPEDRISVILWDAEIGEVTSGHYSHKTQTFYHCGDAIENEITHWMPPPCAP